MRIAKKISPYAFRVIACSICWRKSQSVTASPYIRLALGDWPKLTFLKVASP